jgi:transcriptional regulator with XRE-family HTH domain
MKTLNNRIDAMLYMIEDSKVNPTTIAQQTGINRGQVYRWKKREIKEIRLDSLHAVANALGYTINLIGNQVEITDNKNSTISPHTNSAGQEKTMNTLAEVQDELIKSQKQLLQIQQDEIKALKAEKTRAWPDDPAKYKLFVDIIPHCKSKIELKNIFNFNKPIERCITNMVGFEKIAELLDMPYSKFRDEYFAQGQWYPNDSHPAERLFSKKTTDRVSNYSKDAREILRNLKYKFLGYDYLSFYVDYQYKDKVVKTIAAIRLEFGIKQVVAEAKTTIINELD